MAANMSEQKRLGIACATPVTMLLCAMAAANLGVSPKSPATHAVSVAHDSFLAAVDAEAVPVTVAMTSLKPEVEAIAEQPPKIEPVAPVTTKTPTTDSPNEEHSAQLANDPDPAETVVEETATPLTDGETDLSTLEEPSTAEAPVDTRIVEAAEEPAIETTTTANAESELLEPVGQGTPEEGTNPESVTNHPIFENTATTEDATIAESAARNSSVESSTLANVPASEEAPAALAESNTEVTEANSPTSAPALATIAIDDEGPTNLPDVKEPTKTAAATSPRTTTPAPTAAPTPTSAVATKAGKPFLGVGIKDTSGNIITTLYAKSTAAKLGVALGDQLVSVNGKSVTNLPTLRIALSGISVSNNITLEVLRDGKRLSLGPLPLGTR